MPCPSLNEKAMGLAHGFQDGRRVGFSQDIPKAMGTPTFLDSCFLPTFLPSRISALIAHYLSPRIFKSYFTQPGFSVNKKIRDL
jgi:hypothetical protein